MSEIKHTPLPWHYIDEWSGIYDSPDMRGAQVRIAEITNTPDYKYNAEFIVRACNSHYGLVEALEAIHEISQDTLNPCYQLVQEIAATARTALNKAKGTSDDK